MTLRERVAQILQGLPVELAHPRRKAVHVWTEAGTVQRELARVRRVAATGRESCDRWELLTPGPEGGPRWVSLLVGSPETVGARLVELVSVGAEVDLSVHRRRRVGGAE